MYAAGSHPECVHGAEFRKRGIARQVMVQILDWIKGRGFHGVNLHASAEGRSLYEKLGFEPTNEMRLKFGRL